MRACRNSVTNLSELWISFKPRRAVLFNIFVCKENVIFSNNVNISKLQFDREYSARLSTLLSRMFDVSNLL